MTTEDQWDRNREGYELFRQLWDSDEVTWYGRFGPSLVRRRLFRDRYRAEFGSGTAARRVRIPWTSPRVR